jgi:hypothetical protein
MIAARAIRSIMTGSAMRSHKENPTAGKADSAVEAMAKAALQGDANDTIYQYEASTDYNPSPMLEKIQAPLHSGPAQRPDPLPSDLQPCGALEE